MLFTEENENQLAYLINGRFEVCKYVTYHQFIVRKCSFSLQFCFDHKSQKILFVFIKILVDTAVFQDMTFVHNNLVDHVVKFRDKAFGTTRLFEQKAQTPFNEREEDKDGVAGTLDDFFVLGWINSVRVFETVKVKIYVGERNCQYTLRRC